MSLEAEAGPLAQHVLRSLHTMVVPGLHLKVSKTDSNPSQGPDSPGVGRVKFTPNVKSHQCRFDVKQVLFQRGILGHQFSVVAG